MIAINNAIHLFKMERNHERGIEEAVNMAQNRKLSTSDVCSSFRNKIYPNKLFRIQREGGSHISKRMYLLSIAKLRLEATSEDEVMRGDRKSYAL